MASPTSSHLLALPAELLNDIFDHVAISSFTSLFIFLTPTTDLPLTLPPPAPLSSVCSRIRTEFTPLYLSTSTSHVRTITVISTDFSDPTLLLEALHNIPSRLRMAAAKGLNHPGSEDNKADDSSDDLDRVSTDAAAVVGPRHVRIQIKITKVDSVVANLLTFVKHMGAEYERHVNGTIKASDEPTRVEECMEFSIHFAEKDSKKLRRDVERLRQHFARLRITWARQPRLMSEKLAFQKLYDAIAEAAAQVDGVTAKQFRLGYWNRKDGSFCFV